MHLDKSSFSTLIEHAPLVSIDLLIKNTEGKYLLGRRNNRPAQGYWFVPGGRIFKNESLDAAFTRICKQELGIVQKRSQSVLLGAYDHFYSDYVFGEDISTHYVALGHELAVDIPLNQLPDKQHNDFKWFALDEMLSHHDVHKHTRWYVEGRG